MVKIVPKSKSKADFCGVDKYYYIVRPDLTCYMRSTNFNRGEDLEIFSLHPSCRNGDHYLAHEDDLFYIIQSNYYRRVTNMNTDEGAVVYTLHPNCQGGDHYLSAFGYFYIIFQNRGVYRRTKNMNKDEESEEFTLHPENKNGLYYFGVKNYYYLIKPDDKWGIQYTRCTNFNTNENAENFSFHPSIYSFLPGGLAIAKGPSFGEWVCIKTIGNDSQTPIEWKNRVTKKVGYEKEAMHSIEHNWKVSTTVSAETGGLSALVAKAQISVTAEYGGCSTNTEKENWNEATEVEETVTLTLKPKQKIFIYVYQMGFGKDPVLHCRDMRILDTATPPTDNPLPPAVN
ncbi:uncharacterized protein [Pyxicephalus adspersus]|uniref:uncharacterized protein n=1 Tax=Pyxicephalus adspersus TaxID=30357 RepID=UPI003B5BFCEC